ncbi:MAG: DNA topoisomerase III, partial [Oscillibacter sp.]|nr:DNA topoisomerase III [Oscillibacter sp.]
TEDMAEGLPALCEQTASALPFVKGIPLPVHPALVIDRGKVTDHHAVIPTAEIARADLDALQKGERDILRMIAARLLCAVGDPHRYAETAVTLECGGAGFGAKGRTVTEQGWKAVESAFRDTIRREKPKRSGQKSQQEDQEQGQREGQDESQQEPPQPLPLLDEGQTIPVRVAAVRQGSTKPPSRFTEDTLLSAMEHASAEDFAKIESPERTGLGTPATRAATIEKLVKSKFAERKKRQIVPTEKGMELIRVLPETLTSAKLTADWEERLQQVERGELAPEVFLSGIAAMVRDLVRSYDGKTPEPSPLSQSWRPIVGTCPRCGRSVAEGKFSFHCSGYYDQPPCMFAIWKDERFFTAKRKKVTRSLASTLLQHGRVRMTGLYSEKKDTTYDATVVMEDTGEKHLRFRLEFDEKPAKESSSPKKRGTRRRPE